MYIADIIEHKSRDGRHTAKCLGLEVISANAEHDLCHAMATMNLPEGSITFLRAGKPSLTFRSIYRAAKYRVAAGEKFPQRVKRQVVDAQNRPKPVQGVVAEP